jgi:hypothetical protein
MQPGKVALMPHYFSVYFDGALSFDVADCHRQTVFGGTLKAHMHMIGHRKPFQQIDAPVSAQLLKYLANPSPNSTLKLFLTVFGNKHNMILAFPFNMSHTLTIRHSALHDHCPCRGLPHGATLFYFPRIEKAFSSLTAKGLGLI